MLLSSHVIQRTDSRLSAEADPMGHSLELSASKSVSYRNPGSLESNLFRYFITGTNRQPTEKVGHELLKHTARAGGANKETSDIRPTSC